MKGLTRRWRLRRAGEQEAPPLPLFSRLLRARGLDDDETVRRFCTPKLTDLHDPDLLPNMAVAAKRSGLFPVRQARSSNREPTKRHARLWTAMAKIAKSAICERSDQGADGLS